MIKIVLIFLLSFGFATSEEWTYTGDHGQDSWGTSYPTCNGNQQSPIDIPENVIFDQDLQTFEFRNYELQTNGNITNNGHTIQVDINASAATYPYLQNGNLKGKYRAFQLHFHWGVDGDSGSEHTINGQKYPLELHIVHFKEEYGTYTVASNKTDGLAVVGFLYKESTLSNVQYDRLISAISDVQPGGTPKTFTNFSLLNLTLEQLKTSTYGQSLPLYRYQGSLTTPPCSEIVTWTVMKDPIYISSTQLNAFHNIYAKKNSKEFLTENHRSIQSLIGRTVYTSMNTGTSVLLSKCLFLLAVVIQRMY